MPAQRKISTRQTQIMLDFMEEHSDLALSVRPTPAGQPGPSKQDLDNLWRQLAEKLNDTKCGVTKSPKNWNIYWNNVKYKVRSKVAMIRKNRVPIPGRPGWVGGYLTLEESRILSLLGEETEIDVMPMEVPCLLEESCDTETSSPGQQVDRNSFLKPSFCSDDEDFEDPLQTLNSSEEPMPQKTYIPILYSNGQTDLSTQVLPQQNASSTTNTDRQEEQSIRLRILRLQEEKEKELLKQATIKTKQEKLKLEMLELQMKTIKDSL